MSDLMDVETVGGNVPGGVSSVVDVSTLHIVLRPFDGDGVSRVRGEVVDTATWRTANSLVEHRYLTGSLPVHFASNPQWSMADVKQCECGRRFLGQTPEHGHGPGESVAVMTAEKQAKIAAVKARLDARDRVPLTRDQIETLAGGTTLTDMED